MLLALFVTPVLLAASAAGIIRAVALSADQRGVSQMAAADLLITQTGSSPDSERLNQLLESAAPGATLVDVEYSLDFPVLLGGVTTSVSYRETDWSADATRGWVRPRAGRLPAAVGEIAVSTEIAKQFDLRVGDSLGYRWAKDPSVITGIFEDPAAYRSGLVLAPSGQLGRWLDGVHDGETHATRSRLLKAPPMAVARAKEAVSGAGFTAKSREDVLDGVSLIEKEPGLVLFPGLLLVCVGAAAAFGVRVRQLRREFSLLSAVGLDARWILRTCRLAGSLASACGAIIGLSVGTLLSVLVRPWLREAVQHDLSPLAVPWLSGPVLILLTMAAGTLSVWWPARTALNTPVSRRLGATPERRAARMARARIAFTAVGAAGVSAAMVVSSRSAASMSGLIGCAGLCIAVLLLLPGMLRLLARVTRDASVAARVALRSMAREPRRPVAAVSIGFFAVSVATAALAMLNSAAANERSTYVGSRHLGQVEVVLRHTDATPQITDAIGRTLEGSEITLNKAVVLPAPTGAGRSARLSAPQFYVAPVAADRAPNTLRKAVQVVDSQAEFRALTGRAATTREWQALEGGQLLVMSAVFSDRGTGLLLEPDPVSGEPKPVKIPAVTVADPVDETTLIRAGAVLTSSAARQLGATVQTQTLVATASDGEAPSEAVETQLARALEPLDIPITDVRIERGPSAPKPVLWYILLSMAGVAVVASMALALSASAQELRPDLRRLHDMGFHRGIQRRILAYQSVVVAGLATTAGAAAGLVLAAARVWAFDAELTVNWATLFGAIAAIVVLSAFLGALLAPRAKTLREAS
ncbi:FtsX-like permease family protein [Kitasatospora sp. NPDC057692]|uniref:FtsX-like permease family protein n=1 Tax=Kitasatospora sp. NPDC057692 TaxID=3346215 RepID=UPI0036ABB9DB